VELLRNGERHDQAVADSIRTLRHGASPASPGNYELTLRSRLPDGSWRIQAERDGRVARAPSSPGPLAIARRSICECPGTAAAKRVRQDVAVAQPEATAASLRLREAHRQPAPSRRLRHRRIPRRQPLAYQPLTYGDGSRYALVWRANRDRIGILIASIPVNLHPSHEGALRHATQAGGSRKAVLCLGSLCLAPGASGFK